MKRFFLSAGLVAVGAATSLQSALADDPAITPASPKIWSVSATLRGFYDDNYSINNTKRGSFGVELTPSGSINASLPQTDLGLRYTYGLYWYQQRQIMGINPLDQTHQLDFWLDHAFNERWKANITDTLGVGQEPELIGAGTTVPFRVEGNNLGNHFNFALDTQWTRQFSTSVHYGNDFYDYQNNGTTLANLGINGASLAGLLNRVDQNVGLDLQWHLQLETMLFVGYTFDWDNYTGNEPIGVNPVTLRAYDSDARNSYNHEIYVGIKHQFTANLGGKVSVGGEYTDTYNDSVGNSSSWSPYAQLSLNYTYLPGSYIEVGFSQGVNSTYVSRIASNGSLTQYQKTSTLYGDINHHFTEKLLATAIAQFNYSDYEGGPSLGPDVMYSLGLNLSYQFNRYLSGDIGYNYDKLRSDVAGSAYERNRYYIGVTATY